MKGFRQTMYLLLIVAFGVAVSSGWVLVRYNSRAADSSGVGSIVDPGAPSLPDQVDAKPFEGAVSGAKTRSEMITEVQNAIGSKGKVATADLALITLEGYTTSERAPYTEHPAWIIGVTDHVFSNPYTEPGVVAKPLTENRFYVFEPNGDPVASLGVRVSGGELYPVGSLPTG